MHMWTHMCVQKNNPSLILAFTNFLSVPHSAHHHYSVYPIVHSKWAISRDNNVIFTTSLASEIFLTFFLCAFRTLLQRTCPWPLEIFPDKTVLEIFVLKLSPGFFLVFHISRPDEYQNYIIYLKCHLGKTEGKRCKESGSKACHSLKDKQKQCGNQLSWCCLWRTWGRKASSDLPA